MHRLSAQRTIFHFAQMSTFCRSNVHFYPLNCPLNPLKCPSPISTLIIDQWFSGAGLWAWERLCSILYQNNLIKIIICKQFRPCSDCSITWAAWFWSILFATEVPKFQGETASIVNGTIKSDGMTGHKNQEDSSVPKRFQVPRIYRQYPWYHASVFLYQVNRVYLFCHVPYAI